MNKVFGNVYPFTTEDISQYFPVLEMEDKSVLTVGSSGDQAFNALLCGANKITIIDISPMTEGFVKLKRDLILNNSRRSLYYRVLENEEYRLSKDYFSLNDLQKMNMYMVNDYEYERLRDRLDSTEIEFIEGDIFKMDDALEDRKFDRIIFSNVLQYLEFFVKSHGYSDDQEFLQDKFKEWVKHLKDDGILELLYLYSVIGQKKELIRLAKALQEEIIYISRFKNINEQGESAIVYYRKK